MRRYLALVVACLACLAAGCSSGSKPAQPGAGAAAKGGTASARRLIFLTNGDDPFWDACNAGLQEGAKQYDIAAKGLTVVMEKNNGTAQGQIEKLRQFASQSDIAGVAISVIQADNVAIIEEMKNLAAKGVKVITVDSDVDRARFRDARPYYIGTDNIVGGRLLGAAAAKILASKNVTSGGYVQFAGFTDVDNARQRMDGFKEAVGTAYTELDRMPDQMEGAKARDNVRTALVNHPDLVALVGIWAYDAPAIAEVVKERDVRAKTAVVTFDAQAVALEHMADGLIDAMVVQNPFEMGGQTVRLLVALIENDAKVLADMFPKKDAENGDIYTTGLRLVVPDENSPVKADEMPKDIPHERRTLNEFREWLKRYNLSSS
ncbi:MAG: substrate-binding domain-containing protein [Planctomycetaceae bacterium]